MAHATNDQKQAIHIEADRDDQRQVVLHPDNDDLFVRTGRQVIESCRLGISIELWLTELNGMLENMRQWAADHAERVRACFAAARGSRIVIFVVPVAGRFDFDLADDLVELNAQLVSQFNVGMIEIHQIPWEELDRFLNVNGARRIYGEQPATHPAMEA